MVRRLLWTLFLVFPAFFFLHSLNTQASAADYDGVTINDHHVSGNGGAINSTVINGIANSYFSGNSATNFGGAIYAGTITNGVRGSSFSNNSASEGGAIYANNFGGGITSSTFTGNRATLLGGAIASSTLTGGISNSLFSDNIAGDSGGAIYAYSMQGDISGSQFIGNTARSGGALGVVSIFYGNIHNSYFSGNRATVSGGAVTINFSSSVISESIFEGNQAGNAGGAIFSSLMSGVTIRNSQFLSNSAGRGGALFLSTSASLTPTDLFLSATAGRETIFVGNRDSGGANSLYFGRYGNGNSLSDAALTVRGEGRVKLYDPIRVDMNNDKSFTFEHNSTGQLIWGGINNISVTGSGKSEFHFNSGNTTLLSNYSLRALAGTSMDVHLNNNHTLTLDLTDRDGSKAFLDFTRSGTLGTFNINGAGTRVTALRSLLSSQGRYLLVDGYDELGSAGSTSDITFIPVPGAHFVLDDSITNQLWLVYSYTATSPDTYRPNVRRALRALDQMVRHSDHGLNMTDAEFEAFKADIDSATPEAAVTMGLIGMQAHEATVNTALRSALGAQAGRYQATAASNGLQSIMPRAAFIPRVHGAFPKDGWPENVAGALQRAPGPTASLGWTPAVDDTRQTLLAALRKDDQGERLGSGRTLPAYAGTGELPYAGSGDLYSPYGMNFWAGYIGNFASADGHNGYFGYDSTTNGALAGLTWTITPQWTAGFYSGYSKTETDWKGLNAEGEADGFHLGLFGRYSYESGFSLTADAAWSYFDTDVERTPVGANMSKGAFDQNVYSLGLEADFTFILSENGRFTPYAGLRRTWSRQGAFTEENGVLAANLGSADTSSFVSTLGAALAHDFLIGERAAITHAFELAWSHEYGDQQVKTRGNTFTTPLVTGEAPIAFDTYSLPRDREIFQAGASLQAMILRDSGSAVSFKAAYSLDFSENYNGHTVFLGLQVDF